MHPREKLIRSCLTAISAGDTDIWLSCYTEDAVSEDIPLNSIWAGRTGLEDGVRSWLKAIPDTDMKIRSLRVEDRFGTCEWTMSGTLQGSIDGLPPTDRLPRRRKAFLHERSDGLRVLSRRPHSA